MRARRVAVATLGATIIVTAIARASTIQEFQIQGLKGDTPDTWQTETPTSPLRDAQMSLPGSGGPAELAIIFFGAGAGGDSEANIARWIRQMDPQTGQPVLEQFTVGSFSVKFIDVSGTLKPSSMTVEPKTPRPHSRLFGAIVEGSSGRWFFKATGPADTMQEQRDAFLTFLKSLHK